MLTIFFKPTFVRQYQKLEPQLQEEILEKIGLFKNPKNHKRLKVHKLTGQLSDRYSFSVNYKILIVFLYIYKKEAILLALGDHNIYR